MCQAVMSCYHFSLPGLGRGDGDCVGTMMVGLVGQADNQSTAMTRCWSDVLCVQQKVDEDS